MYVMLATHWQLNFCYVLRFTNISSVREAFPFPFMCMRKHWNSKILAKKFLRKFFDAGIVKKIRKFSC